MKAAINNAETEKSVAAFHQNLMDTKIWIFIQFPSIIKYSFSFDILFQIFKILIIAYNGPQVI